jgi:dipeptidyl aminopeptidase/acylaminoacyl peptidase
MKKWFCRVVTFLFVSNSLLFSVQAQNDVASPAFDPSPLEIKRVAKVTPRPITSMDLLGMRDVTGMQISPDGKSVSYVVSQAIYENNSYRTALFVVGTDPASVPLNLGSAGPPHWNAAGGYLRIDPQWSPDSRYVTYLMGEKDKRQIWMWSREGSKSEQLTHNAADVDSYEWQADGKRIIFTTVDPITSEEIKSVSERGIVYDSYAGEGFEGSVKAWEGRPIAQAVIATKPRRKQLWIYDLTIRTERKATLEEEAKYNKSASSPKVFTPGVKSYPYKIKQSPNGKFIAYASQLVDPEKSPNFTYALFIKPSDSGEPVELVPPSGLFISDLWWSKDSGEIYFARGSESGGTTLYGIRVGGGAVREVVGSKDSLTQFSFDNGMSRVACLRENPTTPPEVATFDLKDGLLRILAIVNPEFQYFTLSPAIRLEWNNKFGDKSFGYLVKPFNYEPGKRYPLIVTTYRATGFLRGAVGDEYPIQVFAANGFAVLAFDAPPDRSPKPGDFNTVMLIWYSPMASLETATKKLDEMGIIDSNRKGLTGLSYGAEITTFTISHSDLFQAAAVSSNGGRDPMFYYLAHNRWHEEFKKWGLGLPEGNTAAKWRELSPALNAARVNAPLLVQAADSEYLYGLQFYTALREHRKPVELIIYADEGHIKNQPKHRYEIYQRNLDWFNFWLQDKEDPDPAKAEQYKRWRELRKVQEKNEASRIAPKQ